MAIELRHLRYFIAVAEEGHITRASEKLGMQQPPLSQQIKALEQKLGTRLFVREARGVRLTDAGRSFLDDARGVLALLGRAVETARRTARGEQGRISIGVTPTGPFHPFVTEVIRAFRRSYPDVALGMQEALSSGLIQRMRDQTIDVAFVRSPVADPEGLTVTPLPFEPMVVALPTGHGLAGSGVPLPLKSLAKEAFVLYGPPGSGIHDTVIAACHRAGFSPKVVQVTPRITSTLGFVAAGLGVSLVPESMRSVGMNGITYRALRGAGHPAIVLNLVSRRGDPSAVVREFVQAVASRLRRQPVAGRTRGKRRVV